MATDPYANTAEQTSDPYAATAVGAHYNVPAAEAPALRKRLMGEAASRDKAAAEENTQAVAPATTSAPTPGFFKRAWDAVNTPVGTHSDIYNRETQQLNRAQNFAETEKGREAYAKHPILTGAKSVAAGVERDAADMLTPAFIATSVAGPTQEFVKGFAPSLAPVLNTIGKYATAATVGGFGGVGASEALNAVRDDTMKSEDRAKAILGGGSSFSGAAAMAATAIPKVTPGTLRRAAQTVIVGRRAVPNMIRDTIENNRAEVERTTKANAAEVEKTAKANADNETAHATATQKAEQANLDIAAEHGRKVARLKNEDTETLDQHGKTVAQYKADVAAAQKAHEDAVAATTAANQQAATEHEGGVVQALQEREGAEHTAGLREQAAANLQEVTDAYFNKEDATEVRVKKATDKEWTEFHEAAKAPVNVDQLADDLSKINARNPAAAQELHHITAAPEDAAPDSPYAADRAAIMKSQGYGVDYWELPPAKRAEVDAMAATSGFTPEPIDLNPETGVPTSLEDIHRATSIIGQNIANGRYEGVMLGEMKQVLKALNAARTRGAIELGVLPELQRGVKATREFKEAFGKKRPDQKTEKTERKADANPEAVDSVAEQKRLAATAKHDPSLVEDYKAVQAAREHLRSFPKPDQLRKGLASAEPPNRPAENPLPKPPKVKPEPEDPLLHGRQGVPELKQLPVAKPKLEPQLQEPQIQRPGLDEARQAKLGALNKQIDWIHHRGKWVATGAAFSGVLYGILQGNVSKITEAVVAATGALILTDKFATFLERPGVQEFFTRPEPRDIEYFEKLPPDQRAVVVEGLRPAVEEARSRGVKVSPLLLTLIGSQLSQQPKTAGEAKDRVKAVQAGR